MDSCSNATEVQRQVLQNTLQEATQGRQDALADCCVICLDPIAEPCEVQPCQHRNFDYLCVLSWLCDHPTCPLCKASVQQVRHETRGRTETTAIHHPCRESDGPTGSSTSRPRYRPLVRSLDGLSARNGRRGRLRGPLSAQQPAAISDPVRRRREVYRRLLFSKHVGTNRLSHYRDFTPQIFTRDAELVSRARMFVRRELQVFSFLSVDGDGDGEVARPRTGLERRRANNAEFLLEYIIAILKSVDVVGCDGQAEDMLAGFLGRENTKLFLHELKAWLRSPFTKLEDWDRAVQYDEEPLGEVAGAPGPAAAGDRPSEHAFSPGVEKPRDAAGGGFRDGNRPRGDFYRPNSGRTLVDARGARGRQKREAPRREAYTRRE